MKLPAMMFYIGDWLKDPNLGKCDPSTRGIWLDALCAMHDDDRRGQLTGTYEELARICRCTVRQMRDATLKLLGTKTANVTERNGCVTLVNRRMKREWKARQHGVSRSQRYRNRHSVTPAQRKCNSPLSYSVSVSSSKEGKELPPFKIIQGEKELKRIEARLEKLRSFKESWDDADRAELKRHKDRRAELLTILGMSA